MNLAELKTRIKTKETLPNIIIFYGEEYKLIDIYLGFVKKLFSTINNLESFSQVQQLLDSRSLFQNSESLYIIRNDSSFFSADIDMSKITNKLEKKNLYVILTFYSVDTRTKLYKDNENLFVNFSKMSPQILKKNILKQFNITDKQADYIIDVCNCSYGHILLELDKVKDLAEYEGITEDKAFLSCYEEGMFYEELSGDCFELIKSIMNRNIEDCYYFLQESKERADSIFMIITILHNNVKGLLQLQLLPKGSDIQSITGLNGFQQKNLFPYIGKFTSEELVRFMKILKYCEASIKNGMLDESMVLDYILINVL